MPIYILMDLCLERSEHEQTKVFNRSAEQPRHTDLQSQGMVLQRNETSERPQHYVAMIKDKSQLLDREDDGEEYLDGDIFLGDDPYALPDQPSLQSSFNLGAVVIKDHYCRSSKPSETPEGVGGGVCRHILRSCTERTGRPSTTGDAGGSCKVGLQ
jgi:hypothetical protein